MRSPCETASSGSQPRCGPYRSPPAILRPRGTRRPRLRPGSTRPGRGRGRRHSRPAATAPSPPGARRGVPRRSASRQTGSRHPAPTRRATPGAARRTPSAQMPRDPSGRNDRRASRAWPLFGSAAPAPADAPPGSASRRRPRSPMRPSPITSPTITGPVAMPIRTASSTPGGRRIAAFSRHRIDDVETGARRTLGLVFMGARVAEIDEDAVAHELRDKAVVMPDRRAAPALKRRDDIAQIFGVHPVESAAPTPPGRKIAAQWAGPRTFGRRRNGTKLGGAAIRGGRRQCPRRGVAALERRRADEGQPSASMPRRLTISS